ncbi:MAG: MgtC/SapB family protein [Acidobacteria bacterium]|nr:MgtC/SapB family protein [Acidobacteriota bacterium]
MPARNFARHGQLLTVLLEFDGLTPWLCTFHAVLSPQYLRQRVLPLHERGEAYVMLACVDLTAVAGLVAATIGGAAIGLERQWSGHASGPRAHFGGIRTFTMLGGLGGLAGWLSTAGFLPLAVVLLAGAVALIVAAYAAASRVDVDGTTEVAAIVALAAGSLSGSGQVALGGGVVAATALLLLEKTRLHAFVTRIDDAALRASARFAALACVVLPLLPRGPYGPFDAIRPRELWSLVLFFSGLSFIGWIARRVVGKQQGVILSGLLGGIISSTSVSLIFARESRATDAPRLALAAGAVGACTVMLLRVTLACMVLNPALAAALPRYVVPAFVIGVAAVLAAWRLNAPASQESADPGSPLQLRAALQMTALFQVVLFVILFVQARWGAQALVVTSAFVGLTDLDALTLSLARSAGSSGDIPATVVALTAGILANTCLKLGVALVVGRGAFRSATAAALGAMALALVIALLR